MINKIFKLLDEWRELPAYQLERRADIFFAVHLEEILKKNRGIEVDLIIPEFPIRIGELEGENAMNNQSYKVDYFLYDKSENRTILIELKTDLGSKNNKQDEYLTKASKISLHQIIEGLLKIRLASKKKGKYDFLIDKLRKVGWITGENKSTRSIAPESRPEIVYILPENKKKEPNVIDFDDIIKALKNSCEPLTKRFVESLEKWKLEVNKKNKRLLKIMSRK